MNKSDYPTDRTTQVLRAFFEDNEEIKEYLADMIIHIKKICKDRYLEYPKKGRGHKGMFPNVSYALHFRLKGYSTHRAAMEYVDRETGRAIQPLSEPNGLK